MNNLFDVIVIGAGPAGMSASLNMLRYGRSVLLLEKENIGGQISRAINVENLPSLKKINGIDFANNFFDQLLSLKVVFKLEEVIKVIKDNNIFFVETTNKNKYKSKSVIIATGLKPKQINIENEEKLIGHGLSYCAICDGFFFKNMDVCVIGDGNTAFQYSLFLSKYCKNVYLCTLSESFLADNILVQRAKETKNIFIKTFFSIKKINKDDKEDFLKEVIFWNLKTKKEEILSVKGLFVAIGQIPNNDIFKEQILLNNNFIVVDEKMQTNIHGLFAIGDCTKKNVRQVVTAVNDGSISAFFANKYLDNSN